MIVPKYSLHQVGVLADRRVGVDEDHPLLLQVLAELW